MSEIRYTCSLGGLCQSSQILKRNKLKLCSYPFDWIFSDCDMILHCLEDDFNIFLDKSYYIGINETSCNHTYYKKDGIQMFLHHNPLYNEEHYNYFVRCVNRFKQLITAPEHKLFIMTFVNNETMDDTFKEKMISFNSKLLNYTTNYTLLVIFHIPDKKMNHRMLIHKNIHLLELHTLSQSNGLEFGKNDNIYLDTMIKSNYKLTEPRTQTTIRTMRMLFNKNIYK